MLVAWVKIITQLSNQKSLTPAPDHETAKYILHLPGTLKLVGAFNPSEKYARQNGFIFPNFRGENDKKWTPPLNLVMFSKHTHTPQKKEHDLPQNIFIMGKKHPYLENQALFIACFSVVAPNDRMKSMLGNHPTSLHPNHQTSIHSKRVGFGCFLKLWYPKMDGENNGKPYFLMGDLGVPLFFGNIQLFGVPGCYKINK